MADACSSKAEIVISQQQTLVITTKFGLLIETDIRKRATLSDLKPEAKVRCSGRHLENQYNIISLLRINHLDEIYQPSA